MVQVRANGQILELRDKETVKYTKQVADIADVSTVNASFTNSFKAPLSPKNRQIFEMLGIPGEGSQLPYQKIVSQLLDDGVPLIKNGWLDIKQTDSDYQIAIKDGIIDFFKAISGKKLGTDVDLSELNHVKTLETVLASFNNEFYTYLVNDYGGKTVLDLGLGTKAFNIDYLVPSARIQYLWDQVFKTFGFTYSGNIFSNDDFTNAWLTFPKTNSELIQNEIGTYTVDELPPTVILQPARFYYDGFGYEYRNPAFPIAWNDVVELLPGYIETDFEISRLNNFSILQNDSYQFKLNFSASANYILRPIQNPQVEIPFEGKVKIIVYKNGQTESGWTIFSDTEELTVPMSLEVGDIITFKIYALTKEEFFQYTEEVEEGNPNDFIFEVSTDDINWSSFEVKPFQVEYSETDFNNVFKDFDVTSFVKEVMWRFALIPIPDTANNHVTFYTVDELLDEKRGVIDWSDKYVERKPEKYTIGSYAQNNWFRHKYNTEDSIYNDGLIPVNNLNLNEETTLLTSKIYSPEQDIVRLDKLGSPSYLNVFPTLIWQAEVEVDEDENITVKYKGLTGRYYWLKKNVVESSAIFASEQLGDSETVSIFNVASILDTIFSDTIPKYHQGHIRLLNDIRVHDIELSLSITDIVNLDFTRLYYFKQQASYYKLNRVNYEYGKNATGEFIRVKRQE